MAPDVEAIKRLMAERNMSMDELSRLSGISPITLDVIMDSTFFALSYLNPIAEALQVDLDEIWKEE